MPFTIIRNDITKMQTDAIVNAANGSLEMSVGVGRAIYLAAGAEELQASCNKLSPVKVGEAVITAGFGLPARYIIHTVGPSYNYDKYMAAVLLYDCYTNALKLAVEKQCRSIAFPLIASGDKNYPKEDALEVSIRAIRDFLQFDDNDMDIYLVVFDKASFAISRRLLGDVQSFIDENYVAEHLNLRRSYDSTHVKPAALGQKKFQRESQKDFKDNRFDYDLDSLSDSLEEPFAQILVNLISIKGKTDTEIYKQANMDRRLFSKIKKGNGYMPSKRTIIALAIALELTLDETEDLLRQAGFAFSPSQMFDVIIGYFIVNGKYDIFEINEVLFHYKQPLLGG